MSNDGHKYRAKLREVRAYQYDGSLASVAEALDAMKASHSQMSNGTLTFRFPGTIGTPESLRERSTQLHVGQWLVEQPHYPGDHLPGHWVVMSPAEFTKKYEHTDGTPVLEKVSQS
jgi:hypothetical protein